MGVGFLVSVGFLVGELLLVCANGVRDGVAMGSVGINVVSCSVTGFGDHGQCQKTKEKVKIQV